MSQQAVVQSPGDCGCGGGGGDVPCTPCDIPPVDLVMSWTYFGVPSSITLTYVGLEWHGTGAPLFDLQVIFLCNTWVSFRSVDNPGCDGNCLIEPRIDESTCDPLHLTFRVEHGCNFVGGGCIFDDDVFYIDVL